MTPDQIKANAAKTRQQANVARGLSPTAEEEEGIMVTPVVEPPEGERKGQLPDREDQLRRDAAEEMMRKAQQRK